MVTRKQEILQLATTRVLSSLGEPIMRTLDWQLKRRGVQLDSHYCNLKDLSYALEEILGDGVDSILESMFDEVTRLLPTPGIALSEQENLKDGTYLEKIELILNDGAKS